tara:strand:+ start:434 stop:676 length:243 start_codon:yes stop_codon:yes gene_type:complete
VLVFLLHTSGDFAFVRASSLSALLFRDRFWCKEKNGEKRRRHYLLHHHHKLHARLRHSFAAAPFAKRRNAGLRIDTRDSP